jgi:ferric-dicitrate binding protein FerR (iron transport regulator)
MDCLSPEQLVAFVRGAGTDPRGVEAHLRDCPACAMELLLTRETLGELRAKAVRPSTAHLRAVGRKRSSSWIPWAAAAAVLIGAVLFAVVGTGTKPPPTVVVKTPDPVRPKPPAPAPPEPPRPAPEPKKPELPAPPPEPPKPPTEPRPVPAPVRPPEPVKPAPAPEPKPVPEPKKPAPTLVEKAVIARVIHSMGAAAPPVGRTYRAGESVATAKQEFVDVAVEGYGHVYFRENSQAELGAAGEIVLHEGELLARMDPGKKPGVVKTPVMQVEPLAPMFSIMATKTSAEVSILDGRVTAGTATAKGPSTMILKAGKAPEIKPLEAGFASWLPDKLAAKRFTGWFEAEDFPSLQGFRVQPFDGTSGGKAVVQIAEQGAIAAKAGLPFKGRHVVWLRVRQYVPKPVLIDVHVNGQSGGAVTLEGAEGKPWRWVGPVIFNSDHMDLSVTALSRWPFKEGDERRSFPVVVDAAMVSSDLKAVPPEKLTEEGHGLELNFDEPAGK